MLGGQWMTNGIAVIGDIHFPFHNKIALATVLHSIKILQPSYVIQVGDIYDLLSASKFPRSLNIIRPRDEFAKARYCGELMWQTIRKISPNSQCYQLLGNHDLRAAKRIVESAAIFEDLVTDWMQTAYSFDGVKTIFDSREEFELNDIWFIHGYRKAFTHHIHNGKNTVVGHSHTGGVNYVPLGSKIIWELNAGYLGDRFHPALSYTAQKRMTKWTLGMGYIDELGPRFIHIHESDIPVLERNINIRKLIID